MDLSLDFKSSFSADGLEHAISSLERHIKAAFPEITRIFIEAEARRR